MLCVTESSSLFDLALSLSHCSTPQHTVAHCNTPHHTATHCHTLQHTTTHYNTLPRTAAHCHTLQHTATHYNTLQHTATNRPSTHTHSLSLLLSVSLALSVSRPRPLSFQKQDTRRYFSRVSCVICVYRVCGTVCVWECVFVTSPYLCVCICMNVSRVSRVICVYQFAEVMKSPLSLSLPLVLVLSLSKSKTHIDVSRVSHARRALCVYNRLQKRWSRLGSPRSWETRHTMTWPGSSTLPPPVGDSMSINIHVCVYTCIHVSIRMYIYVYTYKGKTHRDVA